MVQTTEKITTTNIDAAGVEHVYIRYLSAAYPARVVMTTPDAVTLVAATHRNVVSGDVGAVERRQETTGGGRGFGHLQSRLGRRHGRRRAAAVGRHRRLVEHADERHLDAHPLRAHAEETEEAEQSHREPTRKPEPRNCTVHAAAVQHHTYSVVTFSVQSRVPASGITDRIGPIRFQPDVVKGDETRLSLFLLSYPTI